jgi:NAD(P)-dependent dehydrogenase (short-subunit alcohol dehydrogenase family)
VAVLDLDESAATEVASQFGGVGIRADVTSEDDLRRAVDVVTERFGDIDVFISNAGAGGLGGPFVPDESWDNAFKVNVMSNVYAARILLPRMVARGSGHLVSTASANALTSNPISMAYAATKHAQLAVAEWLDFTYRSKGVEVTCFCPKGMITPMLIAGAEKSAYAQDALSTAVTPEEAARILLDAVERSDFLAVTHDSVLRDFSTKLPDYSNYMGLMREVHERLAPDVGAIPDAASAASGTDARSAQW